MRSNEQVLKLLPFAKHLAQQIRGRLPIYVELDDLVGCGALGLVDALRKFDARKHVKFESYAQHRIRGAILDGLRSADRASRDLRQKNKKAEKMYSELERRQGRSPSDEEMAEALGISLDKWYHMLRDLQAVGVDWLRPMGVLGVKEIVGFREGSGGTDAGCSQFELCYRREQREILSRALARLPERERQIMLLYYSQHLTMKEVGKRLGIDESRVSQLHSAILTRLQSRVKEIMRHPQPGPHRSSW